MASIAEISIHAPRGGSDSCNICHGSGRIKFQSTLPVGGATALLSASCRRCCNFNPRSPWGERLRNSSTTLFYLHFNPRSPWGERLGIVTQRAGNIPISIHAPRGGSDETSLFQKRLNFVISIHAPRGGSDHNCSVVQFHRLDFNPRSPWGERHPLLVIFNAKMQFQSTLPVGGATLLMGYPPGG